MQDLDIFNKADNTLTAKAYIEQILNQLLMDYQNTQREREKIASWEENQKFSILGIIEVLTDEIRGYAFQVITDKYSSNTQDILKQLNSLKTFEILGLSEWYFSPEFDFQLMKNYVEKLNYLRLLMIEYIADKEGEKP
jgi:conjugal transfer/entry exclusion protein